jgi:short-subunit dehydrogenase
VAGGPYLSIEPKSLVDDINVDLCAVFVINRILIPRLRERPQRSAIINIASCTGYYLSTRVGVYSSTKKSLDVYSRILDLENGDKIDIISVRPFGVTTRMMRMKKGPFMISPRECAVASLADMLAGKKVTFGHYKHKLSSLAFEYLSEVKRFELFEFLWAEARRQTE